MMKMPLKRSDKFLKIFGNDTTIPATSIFALPKKEEENKTISHSA